MSTRIHDGERFSSSISFKFPLPTNIHNAVDLIFSYANLVSEMSSGTDDDWSLLYAVVCLIALCLKYKFSRFSLGQSTCLVCCDNGKVDLSKNSRDTRGMLPPHSPFGPSHVLIHLYLEFIFVIFTIGNVLNWVIR